MAIAPRTATVAEGPNSSQTTITGTLPGDRQTDDLTIVVFAMSGSAATFTAPSGWTQLVAPTQNSGAANEFIAAYYRFNPPSAPVGTTSVAGRVTAICQSYGGVNQTTPVDVAAQTATTTGATTLAAPSITTVTNGALLLSGYMIDTSSRTISEPAGMTSEEEYNQAGGRALELAREVRATAGATGTRTWTYSPTDIALSGAAFSVALRPQTAITVTGSITSTGILRRITTKNPFTGSITATGVLTKLKAVPRTFTASIAAAGTFAKNVTKNPFTGSVTSTGVLVKRGFKTFTGSITATGFFRKSFVRVFTGSITATGNLITALAGRIFGQPGLAKILVEKAGEVRMRIRRG